jgi:hypothetical protein
MLFNHGKYFFLFAAPAALAAQGAPREARACSRLPNESPVVATFSNSASYPSNAVFFFSHPFPGLDGADEAEVTVDGAPARLVSTEAEAERFGATPRQSPGSSAAFRVEPEPRAGQRVVILGRDCRRPSPWGSASDECPLTELTFTAAEADTTPPPTPALTYGVKDFSEVSAGCDEVARPKAYVRVQAPPEPAGASAPVLYVVKAYDDETLARVISSSSAPGDAPSVDIAIHDGNGAKAKCISFRALDLAGNESSAPVVHCDLPAVPTPPPRADGERREATPPSAPPAADGSVTACHASSAATDRPTSRATSLLAAALLLGARRRRRAAQ